MSVPALVGGIALRAYDLPAACAFAAGYGLLVPILIYRIAVRRSRTLVLCEPICFTIERTIVYSLRAVVAASPGTEAEGLSEYMQLTFALGFIYLANTLSKLTRCVLVNSTNPPPESEADAMAQPAGASDPPPLVATDGFWKRTAQTDATAEDARLRFWFRRSSTMMTVLFLVGLTLGIVATGHIYPSTDAPHNRFNQNMRYASTVIGLVLVLSEVTILFWASRSVPRVDQRAVRFLLCATTLLLLPACYRLGVMLQLTPDFTAPTHSALNTRGDKAAFYIVHVLPEWLVAALLAAVNVKEVCTMGLKGDFRWRDETPEERTKRWAKERARAEKKAMKKSNKKAKGGIEVEFEMTMTAKADADSVVTLA
ncbi:hypothetical protein GGX14DRAFT_642113 [Mycena pura]|uniref:Proteophosphoglycan ppg4 n=1 Tax=Mycena pura TaxID=153505 RepID=A0AAD6YQ49_9AGAR|nr:hypothetical protein GGX14DRAFT_642113 [Mycena pura]